MKKKLALWTFVLLLASSMYMLGTIRPDASAHEGSHPTEEGQTAEGSINVYLDGRLLPTPGSVSSDLAEIRVSPQDVADALDLSYRWDEGTRSVYIDEKELPAAADPAKIGANVMALAEPLAKSLGLQYDYDDAGHMVMLGTTKAEKQFIEEEAKVQDVFEGKGLTPVVEADGTKTFTLTAEMSDWAPLKGVLTTAWTYNGQVAGPTLRVTEGDKVRIKFLNKLPEPSTIHWHGLHLPNAMDGVPGITQDEVQPGKEFVYEFTASHAGTFMYHAHYDDMKQIVGGLYGAFLIDPVRKPSPVPASGDLADGMAFDKDYTMVLARMNVNAAVDDEPDYFTINGRSYPDTPPIELKKGQTARVRMINIDPVDVHTMHLHGMDFQVIARNGHPVKTVETMNTVLIGPGETVDVAFRADAPGDWMFHCHILDHTMNGGEHANMGAEMGGLITLVKVSDS